MPTAWGACLQLLAPYASAGRRAGRRGHGCTGSRLARARYTVTPRALGALTATPAAHASGATRGTTQSARHARHVARLASGAQTALLTHAKGIWYSLAARRRQQRAHTRDMAPHRRMFGDSAAPRCASRDQCAGGAQGAHAAGARVSSSGAWDSNLLDVLRARAVVERATRTHTRSAQRCKQRLRVWTCLLHRAERSRGSEPTVRWERSQARGVAP